MLTNKQRLALAKKLARSLIKAGDEGSKPHERCRRIQFMVGHYQSGEHGNGGYCEHALQRHFVDELHKFKV